LLVLHFTINVRLKNDTLVLVRDGWTQIVHFRLLGLHKSCQLQLCVCVGVQLPRIRNLFDGFLQEKTNGFLRDKKNVFRREKQ